VGVVDASEAATEVVTEPGVDETVSGQQVRQQSFKTSGCSAQQLGAVGRTMMLPGRIRSWQQSASIPSFIAESIIQHSISCSP